MIQGTFISSINASSPRHGAAPSSSAINLASLINRGNRGGIVTTSHLLVIASQFFLHEHHASHLPPPFLYELLFLIHLIDRGATLSFFPPTPSYRFSILPPFASCLTSSSSLYELRFTPHASNRSLSLPTPPRHHFSITSPY